MPKPPRPINGQIETHGVSNHTDLQQFRRLHPEDFAKEMALSPTYTRQVSLQRPCWRSAIFARTANGLHIRRSQPMVSEASTMSACTGAHRTVPPVLSSDIRSVSLNQQ